MKTSRVEELFMEKTGRGFLPRGVERLPVLVAGSFPELGRLASLRFLEWVQANPEGVIALPTGKTPEYFIKHTVRCLRQWSTPEMQRELAEGGIEPGGRPDMAGLRFVQIDEFYPISPAQQNSFHYYVKKFYIDGFGLSPERAMLIDAERLGIPEGMSLEQVWGDDLVDVGLRYRIPGGEKDKLRKSAIEAVDQWCTEYEQRIRELGGLGFFLGGIGPDGHIGFNVSGSDHNSTARLTAVNYETQAAAAADLGGIEIARKRLVITIGLATIACNPDCTAVILAAGEAKARVVADAVMPPPSLRHPASVLQKLTGARMYLTEGAASRLSARRLEVLTRASELSEEEVERIVVDLSIAKGKRIAELGESDYRSDPFGAEALQRTGRVCAELNRTALASLTAKLQAGMSTRSGARFLHTEPHHDDLMLGYLPYIVRHIRDHSTTHHFATMTSGFTAVTNQYMLALVRKLKLSLAAGGMQTLAAAGYFDPANAALKDHDVWTYLDGVAAGSEQLCAEGVLRRLLRDMIVLYDEQDLDNIAHRLDELINYFETQYPGKKDLPHIQILKGMCREWESSCLWGYLGWNSPSVEHLRLGFYSGDLFTEEPTLSRDVPPILDLLRRARPDVISVALDPEGAGPDTHYKVLQATAEALRAYERESGREDLEVLGYRNVWHRFHPSEANIFVPVSLNMLTLQSASFATAYLSQKDASFPSWEYDGPFSELARKIQVEQYSLLTRCLGRDFFYDHPSALIRATRGFVFLRRMRSAEFYGRCRTLRRAAEAR